VRATASDRHQESPVLIRANIVNASEDVLLLAKELLGQNRRRPVLRLPAQARCTRTSRGGAAAWKCSLRAAPLAAKFVASLLTVGASVGSPWRERAA